VAREPHRASGGAYALDEAFRVEARGSSSPIEKVAYATYGMQINLIPFLV